MHFQTIAYISRKSRIKRLNTFLTRRNTCMQNAYKKTTQRSPGQPSGAPLSRPASALASQAGPPPPQPLDRPVVAAPRSREVPRVELSARSGPGLPPRGRGRPRLRAPAPANRQRDGGACGGRRASGSPACAWSWSRRRQGRVRSWPSDEKKSWPSDEKKDPMKKTKKDPGEGVGPPGSAASGGRGAFNEQNG